MKTLLQLIIVLSMGLFSTNSISQCLIDSYGQYPGGIYVPNICDGSTPNEIASDCWTGEFSVVALLAGNSYTFSSSLATDYITISDETGTTPVVFAVATVDFTPTVTGNYRFYLHNSSACDDDQNSRSRIIVCTGTVGCLTGTLYPAATFMPEFCDGQTGNDIATNCYAGQYSNVGLIGGTLYAFVSSNFEDYITISNDAGTTVLVSGFEFVFYNPIVNETVRFYTHADFTCGTENVDRTRTVYCLGSTTGLAGPCAVGDMWPGKEYGPTCTGNPEEIAADCYAGEYSMVSLQANTVYEFTSSVSSDWITITGIDGLTVLDFGFGPISINPGASNISVRFYTHTDSLCGSDNNDRSRLVKCNTISSGVLEMNLANFKLFPNPTSDKISIVGELTFDEIQIVSIDGRTLKTISPSNTVTEIDVNELAKGTYFARVKANGEIMTKEFVKR